MDVPTTPTDIFPPYRMRGPKRGVVLVINNIEFENNIHGKRNGADVDAENLRELFRQLGFEWIYWENQTHKDFRNKLREFTNHTNTVLTEVDSCFVIVMSHGGQGSVPEDTHIITHDNKQIKASYIISNFSNSNCKLLQGKPKVIIFQACRGALKECAIPVHSESNTKNQMNSTESDEGPLSQTSSETTISNLESDMLICYTTSPGYLSFRDPSKGTWFIQNFCEIFMNHAYHKDVYTLFGMITAKVIKERAENNALQKPHIHTILFRPCYLNPLASNSYPMRESKRCVALVINNEEFGHCDEKYFSRTKIDVENLRKLFTQMGFVWIYWENQTYKQLTNKLQDFIEDSNKTLNQFDSCFVIVMSPGCEGNVSLETQIITHDNKQIQASYIINKFRNSNCKSLRGKPKVIVFQANRGNHILLRGKPTKRVETLDEDISDMLVCYSSKPGCLSFSDPLHGGWFIQSFCEIFKNHVYHKDVETLFGMVAAKVAKKRTILYKARQLPCIEIYSFRPCYLNPSPGHELLEAYASNRGVALVIDNKVFKHVSSCFERRPGAEIDAKNLELLFIKLGFIWIYWKNQTYESIENKLREFTDNSNKLLSEVDSCFVIIMSRGGSGNIPEDTHIYTHDNKPIKANYIINKFSNSNCESLRGKPKVIVFQADRGMKNAVSKPTKSIATTIGLDENLSDMLICYSSNPGYPSFHDNEGTWLVQSFCEIFMNHAHNTDVETLFDMIVAEVAKKRTIRDEIQFPCIEIYSFRTMYLNSLPIHKENESEYIFDAR